jgi:hypothetical protein
MVADAQEEARVREVIKQYALPDPSGTFDFDSLPKNAIGAYVAQTDTFLLRRGAQAQTIIHEAAHAEHYAVAGIVGAKFPTDQDTAVGALILSEAFVGHRLAGVAGFLPFEYGRLQKYSKTLVEIAEQFRTELDAQGPPAPDGNFIPGRIMTVDMFGFLLINLPVVVAEIETKNAIVTAGLTATSSHSKVIGTGASLLKAWQDVIGLVANAASPSAVRAALVSAANMKSVGASFMAGLRDHGVV